MSYEYRIITDKKSNIDDLNLIHNSLKKYSLFHKAILTEHAIYVPDEVGSESVGIGLIDEGFFITANINGKEREVLFNIIWDTMSEKGINIVIEEG